MTAGDAILSVCDENVEHVVSVVQVLSLIDDARDWYGELAAAAQQWQPFLDRGLSIDAWLVAVASDLL